VIDCGVNILLWYSIMFNKHLKEELKCWNPDKITCKQFPVLSSFMTYHRVCNYINTTGVTSGAGTSNSSGPPEFIPGFQWGLFYSFYSLCVCFVDCFLSFCTFSFGHYVVPSSSNYGFWSPLWYLQTLIVLLSFFFWPLCCLFFFDIRILIDPLVSSNSSYNQQFLTWTSRYVDKTNRQFYNFHSECDYKTRLHPKTEVVHEKSSLNVKVIVYYSNCIL
jgi:hypothetical protein